MNDNPSVIHWSNFVAWLRLLSANVGNCSWMSHHMQTVLILEYSDSCELIQRTPITRFESAIRCSSFCCCLMTPHKGNIGICYWTSRWTQTIQNLSTLVELAKCNERQSHDSNQRFVVTFVAWWRPISTTSAVISDLLVWLIQRMPITRFESAIRCYDSDA